CRRRSYLSGTRCQVARRQKFPLSREPRPLATTSPQRRDGFLRNTHRHHYLSTDGSVLWAFPLPQAGKDNQHLQPHTSAHFHQWLRRPDRAPPVRAPRTRPKILLSLPTTATLQPVPWAPAAAAPFSAHLL